MQRKRISFSNELHVLMDSIGGLHSLTADSAHRDHRDRVIMIARIGIVITESERSDVFGWLGVRRKVQSRSRSGATVLGSVSSLASCA